MYWVLRGSQCGETQRPRDQSLIHLCGYRPRAGHAAWGQSKKPTAALRTSCPFPELPGRRAQLSLTARGLPLPRDSEQRFWRPQQLCSTAVSPLGLCLSSEGAKASPPFPGPSDPKGAVATHRPAQQHPPPSGSLRSNEGQDAETLRVTARRGSPAPDPGLGASGGRSSIGALPAFSTVLQRPATQRGSARIPPVCSA